jgi:integrase
VRVVNLTGCPKANTRDTRTLSTLTARLAVWSAPTHSNLKKAIMEYLTRNELVRLFKVARDHNKLHHVAMLVGLLHGLRVSEMLAIRGRDYCDGMLSVKRLKKSRPTLHALRFDSDPLFDESPLLELAQADPDAKLFDGWRQYMDVIIKRYGALTGLHPSRLHFHALKHSICVLLWQETHDLNAIQDHVGHRSASSTLVYLRADAAQKAQSTIAGMSFGGAL